jgi:hypothetical protein
MLNTSISRRANRQLRNCVEGLRAQAALLPAGTEARQDLIELAKAMEFEMVLTPEDVEDRLRFHRLTRVLEKLTRAGKDLRDRGYRQAYRELVLHCRRREGELAPKHLAHLQRELDALDQPEANRA